MSKERLTMSGERPTKFSEIPSKSKRGGARDGSGRKPKELGAARLVLNVWASVERQHRLGGLGHPGFWECVDTGKRDRRSLERIAASLGIEVSEVSFGNLRGDVVATRGEFSSESGVPDCSSSARMYESSAEKYQRRGRLVVSRYVVHEDVVDCCKLATGAFAKVRASQMFKDAVLVTWPRFGRYAGHPDDDDGGRRERPYMRFTRSGNEEVARVLGHLRCHDVHDALARTLAAMEEHYLSELQLMVCSQWGLVSAYEPVDQGEDEG